MNTSNLNSPASNAALFISPQELGALQSGAAAALLLDVRPQARFDASTHMLTGAQRCSPADVPALAASLLAENPGQKVVVYCVYGHQVSMGAAAALRAAGLDAIALAGGFEGGEDGVDSAQNIALWRSAQLPTIVKAGP